MCGASTYSCRAPLRKMLASCQLLIKFSLGSIFQDQVNTSLRIQYHRQIMINPAYNYINEAMGTSILEMYKFYLIIEISIKAKNIRMAKMTLNLHFTAQLMFDLRLFELALEKNFQSDNLITLFHKRKYCQPLLLTRMINQRTQMAKAYESIHFQCSHSAHLMWAY